VKISSIFHPGVGAFIGQERFFTKSFSKNRLQRYSIKKQILIIN
jgi:hypothetical protein